MEELSEEHFSENHKAGFVSIVGKPNVGKSTLMNELVGEKLAIMTAKAQTTRHRIMGVVSEEDYQIVFSDTPGIIEPKYKLHERMMDFVRGALEDADIIMLVTDIKEEYDEEPVIERLEKLKGEIPILVIINKIDLSKQDEVLEKVAYWKRRLSPKYIIPVSALHKFNTLEVMKTLIELLPKHPPYFPKDTLTDKAERFFAAELIREKIFEHYGQEIPYCTDVEITAFRVIDGILRVNAEIYTERPSQKGIIIGKGGRMLKRVGTEARKDMEAFFGRKIFLDTHVRVMENWRKEKNKLKRLGYEQQ